MPLDYEGGVWTTAPTRLTNEVTQRRVLCFVLYILITGGDRELDFDVFKILRVGLITRTDLDTNMNTKVIVAKSACIIVLTRILLLVRHVLLSFEQHLTMTICNNEKRCTMTICSNKHLTMTICNNE